MITIAAVLASVYFAMRIPRKWLFWIAMGFVIAWIPGDLWILPVVGITSIPAGAWLYIACVAGIGLWARFAARRPVASNPPPVIPTITAEEFNNNRTLTEAREFCLMPPTQKLRA